LVQAGDPPLTWNLGRLIRRGLEGGCGTRVVRCGARVDARAIELRRQLLVAVALLLQTAQAAVTGAQRLGQPGIRAQDLGR